MPCSSNSKKKDLLPDGAELHVVGVGEQRQRDVPEDLPVLEVETVLRRYLAASFADDRRAEDEAVLGFGEVMHLELRHLAHQREGVDVVLLEFFGTATNPVERDHDG